MPALDSGYIAAQQPGSVLQVALTEILSFSKFSEPLTYLHERERTSKRREFTMT